MSLLTPGPKSDINITPMTDVMLVLLVLFLVLQPGLQKGLDVQVPPREEALQIEEDLHRDQIVLYVEPGIEYSINREPVSAAELVTRIREIFEPRARKVLFVKGSEQVLYRDVIRAVDLAMAAGVEVVGLVPRED
jgi:biopolymer transport protein ExbD